MNRIIKSLSVIIFSPFGLLSQIYGFDTNLITDTCDGKPVMVYKNWDFYQTENNAYDGTKIPLCYNVNSKGITLKDFDVNKNLFMAWKYPSDKSKRKLYKDMLYITRYTIGTNLNVFDTTVTPTLKIVIESRDSILNFNKKYEHLFSGNYNHQGCIISDEFCFPTQKYSEQYLEEIIFTIPILNNALPNSNIELSEFDFQLMYDNEIVRTLNNVPYNSSNDSLVKLRMYDIINTQGFGFNYLFIHDKNGIPSLQNQDIKQIQIDPKPSEKKHIILTIEEHESIYFQEFTSIGVGNVEGSNEKHNFTLEMKGGDICLQSVEIIFEEDDLNLKNGNISFADQYSCLMFAHGSKFSLDDGMKLFYGENGNGILGLRGGNIILKGNSELIIDCPLILKIDHRGDNKLFLDKQSRLIFTKNSYLRDEGYLYIFGNKNQVDLVELSAKNRDRIIFIEDVENNINNESLIVYPNPVQQQNNLHIKIDDTAIIDIFSLDGQLKSSKKVNNSAIDLEGLSSGMYILKSSSQIAKLLVMD